MNSDNLKCPECGYVFEGNTESSAGNCPLCNSEYDTEKASELFKEYESQKTALEPKKKTTKQIALEWLLFFGSFIAFITIAYIIIECILGA